MIKAAARRRERSNEVRRQIWPEVEDSDLWIKDQAKGYTNIPRAMPLMLEIMNELSGGAPVSSAYLELWCRAFEEPVVSLSNARELAFHSGFTGQRAERTWRERIKKLDELGFIKIAPGPAGDLGYALLMNPYKVIKNHKNAGTPGLLSSRYTSLIMRAQETGADDLS
ncbi:hypothetical protein [Brevundimonas sp.]|jgi:hypothetical protein|uniref:hypothetical protein n=1 Tax=Brevundimonas sp. TaxID=1871086 RepID=UPI00391B65C2